MTKNWVQHKKLGEWGQLDHSGGSSYVVGRLDVF